MKPARSLSADLLEHRRFLYGLARSLVRDEHRAEDVVHDTFAAALDKPPAAAKNLRPWLSAVTRNLALRSRRREGRLRRREERAARPERMESTADIAARVELQRRLSSAIAELDEPSRSVIVWRYQEGRRPAEIARMQDIPVRTVESRLRRARKHLRARLDADYGGSRNRWCALMVPAFGLDASATASASGGAGVATTVATVSAVGATIVNTKLILVASALCVAGAFYAGRKFPAATDTDATTEASSQEPAKQPILRPNQEEIIRGLTADLDEARRTNDALTTTNSALRSQVEEALEAGYLPKEQREEADPQRTYAPAKYEKVVKDIAWPEAGEAAAKMVPLLKQLAQSFGSGGAVDPDIGMGIFKWNQKLQTVAVTAISNKVPGEASNGAFTHPTVALNLIHAALAQAELPLTEKQVERLYEIGDAFIEADTRNKAGYGEETFGLQRLIDESALKDKMFADIDEILTAEQRDVLHPPEVRDRMGIDLFSSGTMWYAVAKAVDFKTAEDLPGRLVDLYKEQSNLTEEHVAILQRAAQDWADSFSAAYLEASADPVAQVSRRSAANGMMAGWQKNEQVRIAAVRQLALNKVLLDRVGADGPHAALIRADKRVFVPIKRRE